MTKQELYDKKAELIKASDEILEAVKAENRAILPDEDAKWTKLHDELTAVGRTIEIMDRQEALAESNGRRSEANQPERVTNLSTRAVNVGRITDYERGEALRAWTLGGPANHQGLTESQIAVAKRCGVDPYSKALTFSLSSNSLKATQPASEFGYKPSVEDIRAWKSGMDEQRAALTGLQSTTTTGGYTVADEAMQSLEVALLAYGGMRSVATVIRTATGGPLPIPTTNDTSNKGEIIGENTTSNELEMTFGQLVLDAWKYSSKYILASIEFLQDTSINANQFLGDALGTRIARITNDHFTTGSGSQPNGIVTAAASGVTSVADPPTYDNFVDLVHSVDPAYRNNGRFMMNDATLKSIKKIKILQYSGDTVGVPLWSPSLTLGQPDRILGYEYVINQSMASPGSSVKKVLFGDFSKYIIRDVKDVTLLRLDELYAVLGQVAFLALSRHDGDLLNAGTNPVKYMQQA